MSKANRIYIVIDANSPKRYLVRAINPWVAQRRVVNQRFIARVATQDELLRLARQGVEVIEATQETPDLDDPDLFPPADEREDIQALP